MSYPLLFAIIGAVTGLTFSLEFNGYFAFALSLLACSFVLVWGKILKSPLIKSMVFMAFVLFGLTTLFVWQGYTTDFHIKRKIAPLFIVAMIQITVICTAFVQSWKPAKPHYSYSDLFENAWNNHFFILFGGLLTGGFLLVLGLGTGLFDSIGIKVSKVIWSEELTPVYVGALIGAGIGISREYDQLIFKVRSVFFAIFRIMAYLAAVIVILFTLSLPFSLDNLFQNKNTSIILLSVVAVSILLLNTLVDKGSNNLPVWANRIFSIQIALLPWLALLSVYAISLRIMQYGLMPKRVIAISIAVLLSLYGIAYLYQLIKHHGHWSRGLIKTNPVLAMIWVTFLIALSSPILDPVRLSVNSQMQRLQSTNVDIDKFDFYALKHRLGRRGKNALKDIQTWTDHSQFSLIEENIKKLEDSSKYYKKQHRVTSITIIGESNKLIEKLKSMNLKSCYNENPCFIKQLHLSKALKAEAVIFKFRKTSLGDYSLTTQIYDPGVWWKEAQNYASKGITASQMKKIIEDLKQDKQKFIAAKYQDLEVGGIKLRQ